MGRLVLKKLYVHELLLKGLENIMQTEKEI